MTVQGKARHMHRFEFLKRIDKAVDDISLEAFNTVSPRRHKSAWFWWTEYGSGGLFFQISSLWPEGSALGPLLFLRHVDENFDGMKSKCAVDQSGSVIEAVKKVVQGSKSTGKLGQERQRKKTLSSVSDEFCKLNIRVGHLRIAQTSVAE